MKFFMVLKWQLKVKIGMIFKLKNCTSDLNFGLEYRQADSKARAKR
jgi:hypothetical protein